jgi:hypothetical protein
MKTLMLEVDDEIMNAYQNFSPDIKKQFNLRVCSLIKRVESSMRSVKLKKLIDELKNEPATQYMNPDILLELLRNEE